MDEDDYVDMTPFNKNINNINIINNNNSNDSNSVIECNDDLEIEDLCYNMSSSYVSTVKHVWLTVEVDKNGDGEPEINTYSSLEKAYRAMEMSFYTDWIGNGYVDNESMFPIPSYAELLEESTKVANNTRFDIYINNNVTFIAYILKREIK